MLAATAAAGAGAATLAGVAAVDVAPDVDIIANWQELAFLRRY